MHTPIPCSACSEAHCYWCGLPFVTDIPDDENHIARPSRDHLLAHTDDEGNVIKGSVLVSAHAFCNSHRKHEEWVWIHAEPKPIRYPDNQQYAIWAMEARLSGRGPIGKGKRANEVRRFYGTPIQRVTIAEASVRPVRAPRQRKGSSWANARKRWLEKWES